MKGFALQGEIMNYKRDIEDSIAAGAPLLHRIETAANYCFKELTTQAIKKLLHAIHPGRGLRTVTATAFFHMAGKFL